MPVKGLDAYRFAVRDSSPILVGSDVKELAEQRRYQEAGVAARSEFRSHIEHYGMQVGMMVQSVHHPDKQYRILEITKPGTLRLAAPESDLPLKSTYSPVVFVPVGTKF